jgi:hypothetical protein
MKIRLPTYHHFDIAATFDLQKNKIAIEREWF